MEPELLIIKPAESFLKSEGVRRQLDKRLLFNIKMCLKEQAIEFDHIDRASPRIFVYTDEVDEAADALRNVFGISKIEKAMQIGTKLDSIKQTALELAKQLKLNKKTSFAIRAKRITKEFPLNSLQIADEVSKFIKDKTKAKVNLKAPKKEIHIELMGQKTFIFAEVIQGLGGFPIGTQGKVLCLINEKKNSIIAAWLLMKRGCEVILFHARDSEKAHQLAQKNVKALEKFAWGSRIKFISEKAEGDLFAQAEKKAEELACKAIVTGHTKFQKEIKQEKFPIFAPLIGFDEEEIRKYGKIIFLNHK